MKHSSWLAMPALLAGASPLAAAEGAGGGGLLTVDAGLMVWTLIVFGLLLLLLKRFAWPVVLGAVEAREKKLEEQIAETARNRDESAALLAEQRKLLADARGEAQQIVAAAKVLSEKERAVAIEKTRHEQEDLLARARREIQAEQEKAVAQLRREAVDLSLAAAAKLIGERLDGDADRKLVTAYLGTLGGGH